MCLARLFYQLRIAGGLGPEDYLGDAHFEVHSDGVFCSDSPSQLDGYFNLVENALYGSKIARLF